jgi:hypothetical protein
VRAWAETTGMPPGHDPTDHRAPETRRSNVDPQIGVRDPPSDLPRGELTHMRLAPSRHSGFCNSRRRIFKVTAIGGCRWVGIGVHPPLPTRWRPAIVSPCS